MIRASSVHRICTHRAIFNEAEYDIKLLEIKEKVKTKLGESFNIDKLDVYVETAGLKTISRDFAKLLKKLAQASLDPLPEGAKTYLEELWLENNYDFYDFSLGEENYATQNGTISEDDAIVLLSEYYDMSFEKNIGRKTLDFFTGECDIHFNNTIRDVKCPQSWKSMRGKLGISSTYYWQLIAYCYLYGAEQAFLDFVLMPVPEELEHLFTKSFSEIEHNKFNLQQKSILELPLNRRVKSFKLNADIPSEIEFMLSRLEKAKIYYSTLTYEKCMKML